VVFTGWPFFFHDHGCDVFSIDHRSNHKLAMNRKCRYAVPGPLLISLEQ
jgi:hypothetical protein